MLIQTAGGSPQGPARPDAQKTDAQKKEERKLDAEQMVREWFRRLNGLDDWWITMDGKEEPDPVVNRMLDLYAPDVMQFLGPSEDQLGTVMYLGHKGIRHWADVFARKYVGLAYRLQNQTAQEQTSDLILTAVPPWGGLAASVEFTAVWTERESRRKFMAPGSAFFVFNEEGKVNKLRLYIPQAEVQEISP
jgi:hypothetical protein